MPRGPQDVRAQDGPVGHRLLHIACGGRRNRGSNTMRRDFGGSSTTAGPLRQAPAGVGELLGLDGQQVPDSVLGRRQAGPPQPLGVKPQPHHFSPVHGRPGPLLLDHAVPGCR